MDTSNLMPGYVHQGFAKAHQAVAVSCYNGEQFIGKSARIPAKIIDESLIWVEWPIRTIEDVALTAINLAGSTVSKGCRENLKYCTVNLKKDLVETLSRGLIIYFPLLFKIQLITHIGIALLQPFEKSYEKVVNHLNSPFAKKVFDEVKKDIFYDYQVQYKKNDQEFHAISQIRKHGIENIKKLTGIYAHLDPKDIIDFSKLSSTTKELEDFLKEVAPKIIEIQSKDALLSNVDKTKRSEINYQIAVLKQEIVNLLNS